MATEVTDRTGYYYLNGERIPLEPAPEVFALKFRSTRNALSENALAFLKDRADPVTFVPQYGIKVYRSPVAERAIAVLGAEDAIEFATPAFRQTFPDQPRERTS